MNITTKQRHQRAIYNAIMWNNAKDLAVEFDANGRINWIKLYDSINNLVYPSGVRMIDCKPLGYTRRATLKQTDIAFCLGFCRAKYNNALCF